jgi:hypothetical protein
MLANGYTPTFAAVDDGVEAIRAVVSLDSYPDDASPSRLLLFSNEDFDRVTHHAPNRTRWIARGLPEHPLNVTLTSGVDLDPNEYPGELPYLHFLHPAPSRLYLL